VLARFAGGKYREELRKIDGGIRNLVWRFKFT
jgi:hypothetical protein